MTHEDERTEEQKKTHNWAVVARDKFMSGWGGAADGISRCARACATLHDAERVEAWVKQRSEMRNVSVVDLSKWRTPRSTAHMHIYVAEPQIHPALRYKEAAQ